jgi:hypothetical protein
MNEAITARCLQHQEPAETACGRCGVFICPLCSSEREQERCTRCEDPLSSIRALARWTARWSWMLPVFALVQAPVPLLVIGARLLFGVVLCAGGMLMGLLSIAQLYRAGREGVLLPALIGIVLSGGLVALAFFFLIYLAASHQ